MAAFSSFHDHPFLLEPNSPSIINKMCALLDEPNNPYFSQFYQPETFQNLDQSTNVSALSNNEAYVLNVSNKNSIDSSSNVTDKYDTQKITPMSKKRKCNEGSSANSAQSKNKKERKAKNGEEKKATEEAPAGYIHVRARRGQATDSHSLAERVRRERISARMKQLQALVPGCDKVTGKALMLDEIINYVQSLQNQVEFLSMKLAAMNPMFYDFEMDLKSFMVKPDQNLSSLPSPLPTVQQSSPTTHTNYALLDNSVNSLLFQQSQIPNALPQGDKEALWDVDGRRHKIVISQDSTTTCFHSININPNMSYKHLS